MIRINAYDLHRLSVQFYFLDFLSVFQHRGRHFFKASVRRRDRQNDLLIRLVQKICPAVLGNISIPHQIFDPFRTDGENQVPFYPAVRHKGLDKKNPVLYVTVLFGLLFRE